MTPPFTITPRILDQVAECCERVGNWRGGQGFSLSPQLRRENRIRSIQASLAIENNSPFLLNSSSKPSQTPC